MIDVALQLIFCHFLGDYVLQIDYLAKTKGENWYHLVAHCVLYCLPFYACFGCSWFILALFVSHMFIDALKARYKVIDYFADQRFHFYVLFMYFLGVSQGLWR